MPDPVEWVRRLEDAAERTLRVFDALSDGALGTRVAPGLKSLGELAWHLTQSHVSIGAQVGIPIPGPGKGVPAPGDVAALREAYGVSARAWREAATALTTEALAGVHSVYGTLWTLAETLQVLLDHETYHLGQMTTLMRQSGLVPPPIFGPVAPDGTVPPEENTGETERLHPNVRWGWTLSDMMEGAVITGSAYAAERFWLGTQEWWPMPPYVATWMVAGWSVAFAALSPWLRYRAWTYTVRRLDVLLESGVIWRRRRSVPRSRVQHVDVRSGPIDRWLGLATCTLFTAGTGQADAEIPGLSRDVAERLRERLVHGG